MRTQFLYVGLLSMVAGGLVGTAGCSDITAGQSSDPSGPPMLVHLVIQDAIFSGSPSAQRTHVTDLLDNSTPLTCSDTQPCVTQFIEGFHVPDFSCSCATMPTSDPAVFLCGAGVTGTCNDPLKTPATGIPIFTNLSGVDPGDAGSGMQIRAVFSKLLNNSIEAVTIDPTQAPGATDTYTLKDGILTLLDGKMMPVPAVTIYDNTGTPGIGTNFPSDLLQVPLGPAPVLKPMAPLDPKTTYTFQMQTGMLKDRTGNAVADAAGQPLPATYTMQFTTEDITRRSGTSFPKAFPTPDAMTMPASIAPNNIFRFSFWSVMDVATAKVVKFTGPTGTSAANLEFFTSQGAGSGAPMDNPAAKCKVGAMSKPTASVRIAFVSAPGVPAEWPAGTYTLDFTIQDRNHVSTYDTKTLTFAVAGKDSDTTMDANTLFTAAGDLGQVLPEQCTGM